MRHELGSIADDVSADASPAHAEPPAALAAELPSHHDTSRKRNIKATRKLGIACAFAATLGLPALSLGMLLAIKPIFPASTHPIGAIVFVLSFVYLVACLFAIGEATSRPLTPRSRLRRPRASVFVAGIALALAGTLIVTAAAPYVSKTLLAKGLVCLQAALCAGGFAACLITSIRLYCVSLNEAFGLPSHANQTMPCEAASEPHRTVWPATLVCRIQNGFDRCTARSLIGIGLISCATGMASMSLFAPTFASFFTLNFIGWAFLAISTLLSILVVRAIRWMKIALAQWAGLLIGLTIGYFSLFSGLIGTQPELPISACALTLFACGLPCMLSHPAEKATFLPTMFPLPESTMTTEEFCTEVADAFGLTPREEETLFLVLENFEAPDIALELGVTVKTAKSYLRKICRKVGSADLDSLIDELDAWYAERYEQPEIPLP